ncbi:uncharacterized protein LOC126323259, partial [Schistocerca gregaria]|uniref:uncharacterized protein LOC126323259 n=1 Tax=Schistocerca gregaria TaxID=7010 RepID=UPI00211EC233
MNKRRELGITVNQTPSFLRLREEFVRKIRTKYDSAFVKLELLSLRTKTGRSPVESSRSLISSLRIGGSGATSPNSTHVSDQQCCVCRRTLRFLDARYACQVCEKVACGQHATQFPSLPPSTAKVDCCRRCHCYLRRYFLLKKLKSRIGGSHRLPVVRVYQKLLEGTSRISASMPGFKGLVLSLVYLFDAFSIDAERPTDEQGAPIFLPQSTIYELVRKAAEAQLELSSRCSELQVDLKALFEIAKNASPTLARLVGSLRLTVMSFLSSNSVEFHNLTSQFLRVQYFFINQGMLDANVVHKVADEQRKASPSPPDQQPKPVPDEQTKKNLSPHLNPEDLFEHHNTALKDIPIGDGPPKIQPNSLSNANLDPFRHWPNSHSAPSPSLLDSFSNRLSRLFQERPSNLSR